MIRNKVVDFFYTIDTILAILRVAVFALLGYAMHQLVFSSDEFADKKRQSSVSDSNPITHQYFIELLALLVIAVILSYGFGCLILEVLEGGMSGWGIEFLAGAIELAGIPALLFFLVLPEMMRTLRGLGYIKTQSNTLGLNAIIFQIIRNSLLSIMVAFGSILGVALVAMEMWGKSKVNAIAFVFAAFTLFLLAFRPTFMGMVGKFSDAKAQLKNGKKVFL